MRVLRRAALVSSLTLILAAPVAFAAPAGSAHTAALRARQEAARPEGFVHRLRGFLVSLWGAEGCGIDPIGRCGQATTTTPTPPPSADAGCGIDPWGRCQPLG